MGGARGGGAGRAAGHGAGNRPTRHGPTIRHLGRAARAGVRTHLGREGLVELHQREGWVAHGVDLGVVLGVVLGVTLGMVGCLLQDGAGVQSPPHHVRLIFAKGLLGG